MSWRSSAITSRRARFEFQVVRDYRAGGTATGLVRPPRGLHGMPPEWCPLIFARPLWDETSNSCDVADESKQLGNDFHGSRCDRCRRIAYAIDNATDRATYSH